MNLYLFALIAIFLVPVVLVYADLEDDTDLLLEDGMRFFQNGEFKKAISYFDQVITIEPNHLEALSKKAEALVKLAKLDDAILYYEKILEIEPNHVETLSKKAGMLVKKGKFDEATHYFDKVLEIEPNNVDALAYKGDELFKMGKLDEAKSYYEQVIKIKPYKLDPNKKSYFDKVLQIDPYNTDALNIKGTSFVRLERTPTGHTIIFMDKLDEAIQLFDKVLEIEPNNIDALFNKGRALVQLEDSEGMSYVDKVLEIEPNHVAALSYKADQFVKYNKLEEGIKYVEKALAIDPDNIEALFNKGSIFARQHNYDEALTIYAEILNKNPENFLVSKNLSITAHKLQHRALDGFLEVTVHDSNNNLVMHLQIPEISVLNHEIGQNFVNSWPVTKVVNRDGQDVEVLQYELVKEVKVGTIYGGANHYGIKLEPANDVHKVYANYWQYIVEKGDTVTFVYTVYRPIA